MFDQKVGESVRVLGIDPGSRVTGYGLLEIHGSGLRCVESGVLKAKGDFNRRLYEIHSDFKSLLKELRPDVLCLERIFLGKNVDSAFKLGHIRGLIIAEAQALEMSVFEYGAREVKKGVTGYGQSDKLQVSQIVKKSLGLKGELSEDASDALALALHFCQGSRDRQSVMTRVQKPSGPSI